MCNAKLAQTSAKLSPYFGVRGNYTGVKGCMLGEFVSMNLITFALVVVYAGGVWKFWRGFHRTNFAQSSSNRLSLSLLWPALLVANKSYRQNFRRALKG